ncbi:MAG: hypothetical protein DI640_12850 [Sphingomonas taxi]|uniref:Peptidase M15C domain-containing protein n=1 Tax=Sphingomonas taxi TaxID=1549858 RepID=A0A2W4YS02_9SPHN|nr:MAG: hypothetical protein DI640_12850 [Sphingomonas taxi]
MKVDGIVGPGTLAAFDKALPALVTIRPAPKPEDDLPESAEAKLKGVHNELVAVVRLASVKSPIPFTVIEGLRTKERQAQLVKAGASKTSNSRHLTGHAVDLWPLDPKTMKTIPSDAAFPQGSNEARAASARLWSDLRKIAGYMREAAKELGVMIEWGGDWGWDAVHFQLNRKAYP